MGQVSLDGPNGTQDGADRSIQFQDFNKEETEKMIRVEIQPVAVFPQTATHLVLTSATVRSFGTDGSAIVTWQLQDSEGNMLKSGIEDLSGTSYQGWNDDLPYLTNWLLDLLGLTAV